MQYQMTVWFSSLVSNVFISLCCVQAFQSRPFNIMQMYWYRIVLDEKTHHFKCVFAQSEKC